LFLLSLGEKWLLFHIGGVELTAQKVEGVKNAFYQIFQQKEKIFVTT